MKVWTQDHVNYLEAQIRRLQRELDETESEEAQDVFREAKIKLINMRRPVGTKL